MMKEALCRGERVTIVRQADAHGLRFFVRFPDGTTAGVRAADLSPIAESGGPVAATTPPAPSSSIPPAFVGLKQKITAFDSRNFDAFVEIMRLARMLSVVDLNMMAHDLNVSGSTLANWTQGSLRPPNRMMAEAVQYIDRGIGAAIVVEHERARERLQNSINNTSAQAHLGGPESLAVEARPQIQVLEIAGETYTIEVREGADGFQATCPQRPGLRVTASNRVDLMIDVKTLILNESDSPPPPSSPPSGPLQDLSLETPSDPCVAPPSLDALLTPRVRQLRSALAQDER